MINPTEEGIKVAEPDYFDRLKAHQESKTFEVGQILFSSWGCSMTIVSWYVVTRRTAKTVWVQPIVGSVTDDNGRGNGRSMPSLYCQPVTDSEGNSVPVKKFRIRNDAGYDYAWDSYHSSSLRIWDMSPKYYNSWD